MALSYDEWMGQLRTIERSAYHLERQPYYAVDLDVYDRWLRGDRRPPVDEAGFREWYDLVAGHVTQGRTVARVRVLEEPPTEYQDFELWCGQWNTAHGEELRSLPRSRAEEINLVAAGEHRDDWWLLDENRLMVMPFDADGTFHPPYLVTERGEVEAALADWSAAVANSTVDRYPITEGETGPEPSSRPGWSG